MLHMVQCTSSTPQVKSIILNPILAFPEYPQCSDLVVQPIKDVIDSLLVHFSPKKNRSASWLHQHHAGSNIRSLPHHCCMYYNVVCISVSICNSSAVIVIRNVQRKLNMTRPPDLRSLCKASASIFLSVEWHLCTANPLIALRFVVCECYPVGEVHLRYFATVSVDNVELSLLLDAHRWDTDEPE